MDWKTIGLSIPEITTRDLLVFHLVPEETEQLARQYNRALFNMNNDGADVAIISLKKIITRFPDWGEPSLLFGICVAQCGEYHRSLSCFEHALTSGLHSQNMTELAQYCLAEAKKDAAEAAKAEELEKKEETPLQALSTAITRQESAMVAESENRERIHVQAPILIKAPKKPTKRRIATEKEIRDALMQSTSSNGEIPDDEIEVDFPKTPAEKMRMTLIGLGIFLLLVGLFFASKYLIIPGVKKLTAKSEDEKKVEFLVDKLSENAADPEVSAILAEYEQEFSGKKKKNEQKETESAPDASEENTDNTDGTMDAE